jgi:hypothetical protein
MAADVNLWEALLLNQSIYVHPAASFVASMVYKDKHPVQTTSRESAS